MRRSASSRPNAASWVRNDSTRLSESIKKSAGRTSPASPARNLAAERRLSSDGARSCRRESHVGDHAPVPPARRAVREKVVAVIRAAPGRDRALGDTQLARLPGQDFPEVHMTRRPVGAVDRGAAPRRAHTRIRLVNPGPPRRGQPLNDLRTYFIARTANTNSTMHYDFRRSDQRGTLQDLYATLEDPPRRAAPPGVEQCHHLLTWHGEVDWDAVGDGDGEQRAARSRHMAVDSVDDQPPVGPVLVPLDRGAVHLVGENHARELLAYRGADGAPPGHHLPDVLLAPQPQGEARVPGARPPSAGGDPGHDPEPVGPFAQLHARDRGVGGGLLPKRQAVGRSDRGRDRHRAAVRLSGRPSSRSMCAPSARSRSSIRSYPRSICPMLWIRESPCAASAASSMAMPALMSGLSTTPPRSADGPAMTARCGSHNTIRAPMPISLSTKKSRDSNSFSNTSTSPSHCEATTMAMDMRSAGNAGHGPSSSLGTWPPRSGRMRRSWSASTTSFEPSRRGRTPSRSNAISVARRSPARTPSIVTAPFVTAARPMNEPTSMWSGPMLKGAAFRWAPPSMVTVFVPMPPISAPSAARKWHRSCTCGSHAAFRSTVGPPAATAAINAFSVAVTLGSSRKMSVPAR